MPSYVYILANHKTGTLYTGVTSNLVQRISQHKEETYSGFTKRYDVKRLVYYEVYDDIVNAIAREKELKKWRRAWKIALFAESNPEWKDLFFEIAS